MSPQSKITLTNLIGIAAIVMSIGGSATLLYSAVKENKASQDKTNGYFAAEILDLKTAREEDRKLSVQTRESQIRMEEQMKELIRRGKR